VRKSLPGNLCPTRLRKSKEASFAIRARTAARAAALGKLLPSRSSTATFFGYFHAMTSSDGLDSWDGREVFAEALLIAKAPDGRKDITLNNLNISARKHRFCQRRVANQRCEDV
jgi:hypothetical protein